MGKANLENDIAAATDTLYRIGSTSKMFVSLSILKLVEERRLSLDDKLADLAPDIEFENRWEETEPVRFAVMVKNSRSPSQLATASRTTAGIDEAPSQSHPPTATGSNSAAVCRSRR